MNKKNLYTPKLLIELHNEMHHQSTHEIYNKKDSEKKTNNKISKHKNFTAKTPYLNLKAPCNNVKLQSDKTLATQIYSLNTQGFFLDGTR